MTTHNTAADTSARPVKNDRPTSFGEQTKKVADDVRELGTMAVTGAGEALNAVKERGSQVVDSAREKAQETFEQGKERLVQARDGLGGYVSENPFKSVLIAAGIGVLIGYSLRNSNRS